MDLIKVRQKISIVFVFSKCIFILPFVHCIIKAVWIVQTNRIIRQLFGPIGNCFLVVYGKIYDKVHQLRQSSMLYLPYITDCCMLLTLVLWSRLWSYYENHSWLTSEMRYGSYVCHSSLNRQSNVYFWTLSNNKTLRPASLTQVNAKLCV
jgi:hypothetical protein